MTSQQCDHSVFTKKQTKTILTLYYAEKHKQNASFCTVSVNQIQTLIGIKCLDWFPMEKYFSRNKNAAIFTGFLWWVQRNVNGYEINGPRVMGWTPFIFILQFRKFYFILISFLPISLIQRTELDKLRHQITTWNHSLLFCYKSQRKSFSGIVINSIRWH